MKLFKISLGILALSLACFAASYGFAQMAGLGTKNFYPAELFKAYLAESGEFREVNIEKKIAAKEVSAITVETASMQVTIVRSGDDQISARLTGLAPKEEPEDQGLRFENVDGHLRVATGDTFADKGLRLDLRGKDFETGLVVAVPERFGALTVKTRSGNIMIDPMTLDSLEISADAGDVRGDRGLVAKDIRISTESGDVALGPARAGKISIASLSGDVHVTFSAADPVAFVKTASGDVGVNFEAEPDVKLIAETRSGELLLEKALGGDEVEGGTRIGVRLGTGKGAVSVETDSGDVRFGRAL